MKIYLTIIVIIISALALSAQEDKKVKKGKPSTPNFSYEHPNNCSPSTALLILNLKRGTDTLTLKNRFPVEEGENGNLSIDAFIHFDETFSSSDLSKHGITVNTITEDILTANIPLNKIENLFRIKGVKYVEISQEAEPVIDQALSKTWSDWVHNGYNLSQSYTGNGVVVGIIDIGFDYTHPTFYDENYYNYRIKRVWEQTINGTHPGGYSYGNEIIGENNILNNEYSSTSHSHGTHVAGIAAGSGSTLSNTMKGVAYESDLVLVPTSMTDSDIADAIGYIQDYANMAGKPSVINMSIGKHVGPHDGTSSFDQICDYYSSSGNILVGAAGNEGGSKIHLDYYFGNDENIYSFMNFSSSSTSPDPQGEGYIDIWGTAGSDFTIALNIYNIDDDQYEDYTQYISTSSNSTYNITLNDNDPLYSDVCDVEISVESQNYYNGKPHALIYFDNTDQDESGDIYDFAEIEINGTYTSVNAWTWSTNSFDDLNVSFTQQLDGNDDYTVGEIGGTGNSIISVGAYTSKNNYYDFNGNYHDIPIYGTLDDIAPFSSKGPTADGRIKPDISAPGNVIVSSVNSYHSNYDQNSDEVVDGVNNGNKEWWFATMQGTSMAAPVATGIIALWLEANPNLNLTQVKQLMYDNAWTDSHTGSVPNNIWGNGKIDAHETMKEIENYVGISNNLTNNDFRIYPNPAESSFNILLNDETLNELNIFNLTGNKMISKKFPIGSKKIKVNINNLSSGMYIIELKNDKYSINNKLIVK